MYRAVAVIVLFIGQALGQDANCDFTQNVQVGQTYYIYNREYSQNYTGGVQCRWIANCPTGYNCRLDCTEIRLPQTQGCSLDRLLISRTGDQFLSGADTYCGLGSLSAVSTSNRISVGLITSRGSPGGRFLCSLRAQVAATDPTSCRCGYKRSNRIVGGEETGVNEFPAMVGLVDLRISEIKCGGVIIDKRFVLTAAHCLTTLTVSTTAALVGAHYTDRDTPATRSYQVMNFKFHDQFNPRNLDYDIALVRTTTEIQFSDQVGPICLPFKFRATDFTGATVQVLGWGTLYPGGPKPGALQKVSLQVISQSSCRSQVSFLSDRQRCTFTRGKDACQDDSGGPGLYTDQATGLLHAVLITSSGQFCASSSPGIYTYVPYFLDWIQANTQANFCVK